MDAILNVQTTTLLFTCTCTEVASLHFRLIIIWMSILKVWKCRWMDLYMSTSHRLHDCGHNHRSRAVLVWRRYGQWEHNVSVCLGQWCASKRFLSFYFFSLAFEIYIAWISPFPVRYCGYFTASSHFFGFIRTYRQNRKSRSPDWCETDALKCTHTQKSVFNCVITYDISRL